MARIKLVYIGGGSTRAAGTMASLVHQGADFEGSEVVLVDLLPDRLDLVRRLAQRMAAARGLDLRVTATTDRRTALADADAVLTSFRPGGFEARALDERIPLRHGVIGQETQGPGGMFMALRSIAVMREIVADIEAVAPAARIFNYTNPVNLVSEAVTHHSGVPIVSLCEGPLFFPRIIATAAGLDPDLVEAPMAGLNHDCWSTAELYDGVPMMPLVEEAWERHREDAEMSPYLRRMLHLAATEGALPADYLLYYYYRDELLDELRAKTSTRAEDILAWSPGYWEHYAEQAESADPVLDPARSRGGIHELELAIDVMDAVFNGKAEVHPMNLPNHGALPGFADDLVVEVPCRVVGGWVEPIPQPALRPQVRGLVEMLAEYQALAAEVGWGGTRRDGIRALVANPLVPSLPVAEALYDDLATAHRAYLPERLCG